MQAGDHLLFVRWEGAGDAEEFVGEGDLAGALYLHVAQIHVGAPGLDVVIGCLVVTDDGFILGECWVGVVTCSPYEFVGAAEFEAEFACDLEAYGAVVGVAVEDGFVFFGGDGGSGFGLCLGCGGVILGHIG